MYGFERFFEVLAMVARSWVEANHLGDGTGCFQESNCSPHVSNKLSQLGQAA